ncbi:toll/interleukin-1 receptor domain-containing protein [Serratia liquefaciens]|uniref:toll/interleukin-1 receptor domain-containing protein n=1 Tax=Serratia liquefaciens TaxID=614 RepID=UPI00235F2408|nr:toll/interleukin-1 receptor domain-containing protein [Serratia liquefaciens]
MSISSNRSAITRIQRDIADLQKKMSDERRKESQFLEKINQINRSITKSTSSSTLNSKLTQIARYSDDISKCDGRKADISKRISGKTIELHRYEAQLVKDEAAEMKKQEAAQKKREKEQLDFQKKITREFEAQKRALQHQLSVTSSTPEFTHAEEHFSPQYDVFISHASEDKDAFVRPFAEHLRHLGISVWYDEFSLQWGDSLRRSIDKGLANSRFGVVVLSKAFVQKRWTEYELNGLVAAEIEGSKRVLPIWHEISKLEVMKFSPTLADKLALNTMTSTTEEIAEQLLSILR